LRRAPTQSPETGSYDNVGIEVAALDADVAQQLGMEDAQGVVITSVKPGSPAARAGLRSTLVIAKVGPKSVTNLEEFDEAMKEANFEKDGVLFLVQTGSGSQFVVVPAPRN
jgi:serine protease Do